VNGAGQPFVGTTTLTGEDAALLMKAGRARLGGFTQPRMLLSVREPGMTVSYAWTRFDHAFETGTHFALTAGPLVVIVPKRAFASDVLVPVREIDASKLPLQPLR
jgi:hypothetical protein